MMQKIYKFFKEKKENGQSVVEYGILVAAVIAAVLVFKTNMDMSTQLSTIGNNIKAQLTKAASDSADPGRAD